MTITLKDGGPAFPQNEPLTSDHAGMSMRRYYAAHAPSAPEWFRLDLDEMPPKIPAVPEEWTAVERAEFAMVKEGTLAPGAACDDVQLFWKRYEPAVARAEAWRLEMRKRKFFAWRFFYADQMLAAERQS